MLMSKDPCATCGAVTYYYWRAVFHDGTRYEQCSECSRTATPSLSPDVYFDESKGSFQTDPNLCARDGKEIPFSSRREKAAILKQLGLRECGDKEHGGRNFDKRASKQWGQI